MLLACLILGGTAVINRPRQFRLGLFLLRNYLMTDLAPKYNPNEVEKGRYQTWLDEDLFKPSGDKSSPIFNCYSTTKCNW